MQLTKEIINQQIDSLAAEREIINQQIAVLEAEKEKWPEDRLTLEDVLTSIEAVRSVAVDEVEF